MQNPKVFRLLVGKDVAVSASGLTPATATDGSIVPFTEDWVELTKYFVIPDNIKEIEYSKIKLHPNIFIPETVIKSDLSLFENTESEEEVYKHDLCKVCQSQNIGK